MSEPDSPVEGSGNDTALSLEDGAAAIENLLSNVPDDPETDEQDSGQIEESTTEGQQNAAGEPDDDLEGLELDDEAPAAEADAPKEPEIKPGQFAPRDAKVKLEDGTTISVSELIAGNMFQRTFTEKTTALAHEKKALESERGQFADTKNQIEQQRTVLLTLATELLPPEPQRPTDPDDPIAYINYMQEKAVYDERMGKLSYLWQSHQQEQATLTHRQQQEYAEQQRINQDNYQKALLAEFDKLYAVLPRLKNKEEFEKFRTTAHEIGHSAYNLRPEEIDSLTDHRHIQILADALAYRKAIAKRDAGKTPPPAQQGQQPRIQQRQRMAPQTTQARDQNSAIDRLRKTGSLDEAAKALMKFV